MHENHHDNPTALAPSKASSAAEVNQYLQHMQERNPEELLGVDAKAGLMRATIQATIISVAILVACTLVPYWFPGLFSRTATPSKPAEQARDDKPADKSETKEAPVATKSEPAKTATPEPTKTATDTSKTKQTVSKEAIDKLGVNDTKAASPKVNPLEKSADDLLKDLDKK